MLKKSYDIAIIGAGPAGLMAAIEAYISLKNIIILEKMHIPALKLKISGKGRCNITNSAGLNEFLSHFGKNGKFLKFAFSEFFNTDLLNFFEKSGITFKLERGGRYFPSKDNAGEIVDALLNKIKSLNIRIQCNSEVSNITMLPDKRFSIHIKDEKNSTNRKRGLQHITAKNVIIATGGKSYPKTGSTGTGYKLAAAFGHTITPLFPSLVPIETKGNIAKKLQGLSLRNVNAQIWCNNKKVGEQFGEMLFTDFGLSGPIILTLSKTIVKLINDKQQVTISIDLKPALEHKKLDQRLLREIHNHSKQNFNSLLKKLLPRKLIPVFVEKLNIVNEKQISQITYQERRKLISLLKGFRIDIHTYRSYDHAIITSGGVKTNEINSQTMESKIVKNLYFAGEIIDIDADTGGYNLQAAFSTGWIAGRATKQSLL